MEFLRIPPKQVDDVTGLRFVVVGIWHAATGYASTLYTHLGFKCGHENIFYNIRERPRNRENYIGESSWKVAPYLSQFTGLKLHQVRDPIKIVNGCIIQGNSTNNQYCQHFAGEYITGVDCLFALPEHEIRLLPNISSFRKRALAAMKEYVFWNKLCEKGEPHIRYRVEELTPEKVCKICDAIGSTKSLKFVEGVLKSIPKNVNTHMEGGDYIIKWSDLPDCHEKEELMEMARRYGYSP